MPLSLSCSLPGQVQQPGSRALPTAIQGVIFGQASDQALFVAVGEELVKLGAGLPRQEEGDQHRAQRADEEESQGQLKSQCTFHDLLRGRP
jgi:hypothetical protein